ncbi:MAG TPA: ATP-grasp domain-containing protein [Nitrososphaeraceae archaeon]|nr:ATP-grasp domain-containing protein [Nitrososphaeraceae archaeon]
MKVGSTSTILVPSASAPAGINTIKSLKMVKYPVRIVASDSNPISAGFFMSDAHEVLPEIDSKLYVSRLLDIVEKHKIEILMPSSGYDIYQYSDNKEKLLKLGALPVVSDKKTMERCKDKMQTFNYLSKKFDLPFTTIDYKKTSRFPLIAKPRYGKGSKGIVKIDNEKELKYVQTKRDKDNLIFQEYLPGTEYTIDVLSDLDCEPIIAVPRIRLETKAGISTMGKIVKDENISDTCKSIAKCLKIRGPCCIQMKESKEGILKIVEVNPRMGGGTFFTTLAGANFPAMILDMVNGKKPKIPKISEITIVRYFEEIVLENGKVMKYDLNLL